MAIGNNLQTKLVSIYDLNWRKLATWCLPTFLRKKRTLAFVYCLIHPLYGLHGEFARFRREMKYRQSHNSQVCYLEAVLNDAFDRKKRRIYIQGVKLREPAYFYEPQENKPLYFYEPQEDKPVYFHTDITYGGDGEDFTVICPADIKPHFPIQQETQLVQMQNLIDYYKLASKSYKIIFQ